MPDLYAISRKFRRELDARDRKAMRILAEMYAPILTRIDAEMKLALADIEGARRSAKLLRLRALRDLIVSEVRRFTQDAAVVILEAAAGEIDEGLRAAAVQLAVVDVTAFGLPNRNALLSLVGTLQEGSPLLKLLESYGVKAGRLASVTLLQGLALGKNPKAVARELHVRMKMPLHRAQMVSRTEMLRAYRTASQESYKAAGGVKGWIWLSALGTRTCPVCYAMHGSFHPLSEPFASHVACRCTQVPSVQGGPTIAKGEDLFKGLTAEQQMQILGPKKYEAWNSGRIELSDLVHVGRDRDWGKYRREKSLADALN